MSTVKTLRFPRALTGAVLMLFLGSMYAWSYFKVALGDVFPTWSQKEITLNFTIMMCVFCLGGVLAGRISGRVPKQAQVAAAGILMFVGFFGVSMLPPDQPALSIVLLYLFYGCLNGLGTGVAYNAVLSSVQPWFPEKSGLISGVLLMSLGLGSLVLGNVASLLVNALGLFITFRIFAFADLAVMLACCAMVRMPGPGDQLPAPTVRAATAETGQEFTTAQMIRRPTFWIYFCWNICMSAGGMLVINSASAISVYYGAAAVIGLLVSLFNSFGRLASGFLMDRIPWKAALFLVNGLMLLAGALLYVGDVAGFSPLVFCGMMIMGIVYGSGITISAALIRKLYGSRNYASNFSVCNLCTFPAAIIGPMISAALQDASTGYLSTYIMVLVIGLIALFANFFIRKP